jgi:8-oxo-dGTP pyrophosphatase MutT (NUDIX family)
MIEFNGAVAIVYFKDANSNVKYVIVQTKRGFSLPGGGKDSEDKTIIQTIKRELLEELGIKEKDYSLTKTNLVEKFKYDSDKEGRAGEESFKAVFIVESYTDKFNPIDKKVLSAKLYTKEEVIKTLSWDNSIKTFNDAIKLIK